MKKLLSLIVVLGLLAFVGTAIVGCGSSGGDDSWTKPAWASETLFPVIVYDANGNFIGHLVGVDFERGWVKIYNDDMGKFFEMTTGWGTMRGLGHRRGNRPIHANANCEPYMWQGWNFFLYYARGEGGLSPVDSDFFTISDDPADSIPATDIVKELVIGNDTGFKEDDYWVCVDYDSTYWQDINAVFFPMVPYTDALPFDHSAGILRFTSD